jgi:nucleotidyltransferase substrate binding protein (TIGR01987 family)
MENLKVIRWKQRFENFEKSFLLLREYIKIKVPSKIERAGGIQFFEMSFELAWKMQKDYLESEGFEPKSPKATLKQAFQSGLIEDGYIWMDALDDRNLTVHTYDETTAEEIEFKIRNDYYFILEKLYNKLKVEL